MSLSAWGGGATSAAAHVGFAEGDPAPAGKPSRLPATCHKCGQMVALAHPGSLSAGREALALQVAGAQFLGEQCDKCGCTWHAYEDCGGRYAEARLLDADMLRQCPVCSGACPCAVTCGQGEGAGVVCVASAAMEGAGRNCGGKRRLSASSDSNSSAVGRVSDARAGAVVAGLSVGSLKAPSSDEVGFERDAKAARLSPAVEPPSSYGDWARIQADSALKAMKSQRVSSGEASLPGALLSSDVGSGPESPGELKRVGQASPKLASSWCATERTEEQAESGRSGHVFDDELDSHPSSCLQTTLPPGREAAIDAALEAAATETSAGQLVQLEMSVPLVRNSSPGSGVGSGATVLAYGFASALFILGTAVSINSEIAGHAAGVMDKAGGAARRMLIGNITDDGSAPSMAHMFDGGGSPLSIWLALILTTGASVTCALAAVLPHSWKVSIAISVFGIPLFITSNYFYFKEWRYLPDDSFNPILIMQKAHVAVNAVQGMVMHIPVPSSKMSEGKLTAEALAVALVAATGTFGPICFGTVVLDKLNWSAVDGSIEGMLSPEARVAVTSLFFAALIRTAYTRWRSQVPHDLVWLQRWGWICELGATFNRMMLYLVFAAVMKQGMDNTGEIVCSIFIFMGSLLAYMDCLFYPFLLQEGGKQTFTNVILTGFLRRAHNVLLCEYRGVPIPLMVTMIAVGAHLTVFKKC